MDKLIETLFNAYPNASCELNYQTNFELLVAIILSAQCTDKRVNAVTSELFKVLKTPQDFVDVDQSQLEKLIFSCGFYRNKANSIKSASADIIERFNGEVPSTLEGLISLKGVGRKTANVMLAVAFNKDALAVDTHVFRVAKRLGFSDANTPNGVENDLIRVFNGKNLSKIHHLLLFHGRYCCKSQRPECDSCPIDQFCPSCKTKAVNPKHKNQNSKSKALNQSTKSKAVKSK